MLGTFMNAKTKKKPSAVAVSAALNRVQHTTNNRQSWNDLESLYTTTAQSMLGVMATLNELISIEKLVDYVHDKETYHAAIRTLTTDFNNLGNELVRIHDEHKSCTGFVKDDKELSDCIRIFGNYTVFYERFQGLTLPTVMSITDMAIEAKDRKDQEQAQQPVIKEQTNV